MVRELAIQFDFRQGAMFNKNRFRENPSKLKFLLAMFEQNLLHVTVLKVNGEMVASIVAVVGKNWVHLGGVNIHTPFYAGYYSPGFVHFMMLGQQLYQEAIAVFDLTPGGDSYKERMATRHDHVYEMTVTSNPVFRLKRLAKKQIHDGLIKAGKRPMAVELSLQKWLYLFKGRIRMAKERGVLRSAVEQIKRTWSDNNQRTYLIQVKPKSQMTPIQLHKNDLGDLLEYDQKSAWLTRWEFLEDAMRRFEEGGVCYTWSEGGQLLGCTWLNSSNPVSENEKPLSDFNAPDGAVVLHELYCHRIGRHRLGDMLSTVIKEVAGEREVRQVYVIVNASDTDLCQALESTCNCVANLSPA
jgi:hypothetical protein